MAERYDPQQVARDGEMLPAQVEDTRLYSMLLGYEATDTLNQAVHNGDSQTQSYFVGDPAARSDISGLAAIEQLRDIVCQMAPIVYIFGEPGSGKTSFSLLLSQLWKRAYPDGELASNIRTWEEADEWLPDYGSLRSWLDEQIDQMEEGGTTRAEDSNRRLFVFDEASSHASGRGSDGYEAGQKLGPLVYKIRKASCGLIIIGHDGKDVHPAVRTLATVVQRYRRELKRATLYEDVQNREGVGQIMELNGVPDTDYHYDDGEATSWSWESEQQRQQERQQEIREAAEDLQDQTVREMAARLAQDDSCDLSFREIGEAIGEAHRGEPFAQSWVSKWADRVD
jgi:energy-coupling factor transporter ATP-binding protein EcfA2